MIFVLITGFSSAVASAAGASVSGSLISSNSADVSSVSVDIMSFLSVCAVVSAAFFTAVSVDFDEYVVTAAVREVTSSFAVADTIYDWFSSEISGGGVSIPLCHSPTPAIAAAHTGHITAIFLRRRADFTASYSWMRLSNYKNS